MHASARMLCLCSALAVTPNTVMYVALQVDVGGVASRIHYSTHVMQHVCVVMSVVLSSCLLISYSCSYFLYSL